MVPACTQVTLRAVLFKRGVREQACGNEILRNLGISREVSRREVFGEGAPLEGIAEGDCCSFVGLLDVLLVNALENNIMVLV